MKKYITRDREAGNELERFETLEEAQAAIEQYEATDKQEGTYTPNFYEIKHQYAYEVWSVKHRKGELDTFGGDEYLIVETDDKAEAIKAARDDRADHEKAGTCYGTSRKNETYETQLREIVNEYGDWNPVEF